MITGATKQLVRVLLSTALAAGIACGSADGATSASAPDKATLSVSLRYTGMASDSNHVLVNVGLETRRLTAGAPQVFTGVSPGSVYVIVSDVAENCQTNRVLIVEAPAGKTTPVDISTTCYGGIAFSAGELFGMTSLYYLAADGRKRMLATGTGTEDVQGFTPDGTRILVSDGRGLLLYPVNGAAPSRILAISVNDAHVSPDGTKVLFNATGVPAGFTSQLGIMNIDGSDIHQLIPGAALDVGYTWSDDGTRIAVLSSRFQTFGEIGTVRVDGSDLRKIPGFNSIVPVYWSPDGTRFLICVGDAPNRSAVVVPASGGPPITVLVAGARYEHAWSPDSKRIALSIESGVAIVNADGSGLLNLGGGSSPSWSGDGTRLVYIDGNGLLMITNADGSGSFKVTGYAISAAANLKWNPAVRQGP